MTDKTQHTPEPWVDKKFIRIKAEGKEIALGQFRCITKVDLRVLSESNYQRAKECVNALAGLTDEQVKQVGEWVKSQSTTLMFDYVSQNRILHKQIEQLQAEIKQLKKGIDITLSSIEGSICGIEDNKGDADVIGISEVESMLNDLFKRLNKLKGE